MVVVVGGGHACGRMGARYSTRNACMQTQCNGVQHGMHLAVCAGRVCHAMQKIMSNVCAAAIYLAIPMGTCTPCTIAADDPRPLQHAFACMQAPGQRRPPPSAPRAGR